MTDSIPSPGKIITFYSYKGGTGRSMALANVACLLAQREVMVGDVLMVDWDLEAPGLHQFFHGRFNDIQNKPGNLPFGHLGLIDLFYEVKARLEKTEVDDEIPDDFFDKLDLPKYTAKLNVPSLFMLPAGKFDDNLYSSRVNEFDWAEFFNNYPTFITRFAQYLRKKYEYILIDSRTGYTDISGICTSIMPEKLVVVFTPNRQSLIGVIELIRRATDYRKQSDDLRPLIVYPLASRIENAEIDLQKEWRYGNPSFGVEGFQKQFELVLKEIYRLQDCDLTGYFDEIQLQYVPRYSYGEEISVLKERAEERLSLARSFKSFTQRLIIENPWREHALDTKLTKTKTNFEAEALPTKKWLSTINVALIGLVGTVIAAIIGSTYFAQLFVPAASTSTPTLTLTSTVTPFPTLTPTLLPIEGIFNVSGPVSYYSEPLLININGSWEDIFFVCSEYISPVIRSYEIAEKPENCTLELNIGWVPIDVVKLPGEFSEARVTLVPFGASDCNDGIDNDGNFLVDFPSDPSCRGIDDNSEDSLVFDLTNTPMPAPTRTKRPSDNPSAKACNDGIDNDGDGFIDGADPQCVSSTDNSENK